MRSTPHVCVVAGAALTLLACSSAVGEPGFGGGGESSSSGGESNSTATSSGGSGSAGGSSGGGGAASSTGSGSSGGSGSSSGGATSGGGAGVDAGSRDASHRAESGSGFDSGGAADATASLSYAADIAPLLDGNCTQACHGGAGMLTISYANIVNVRAGESSLNYVTPNDPGHSYLFCKVNPNDATCTSAGTMISGTRMPPGGSLSTAALTRIKTWIQQNALP